MPGSAISPVLQVLPAAPSPAAPGADTSQAVAPSVPSCPGRPPPLPSRSRSRWWQAARVHDKLWKTTRRDNYGDGVVHSLSENHKGWIIAFVSSLSDEDCEQFTYSDLLRYFVDVFGALSLEAKTQLHALLGQLVAPPLRPPPTSVAAGVAAPAPTRTPTPAPTLAMTTSP